MRIPLLIVTPLFVGAMLVHRAGLPAFGSQAGAGDECGCTDDPPFVRNPIPTAPQPGDLATITRDLSADCVSAAIASRKLGMLANPASVGPLIHALHHKSCRVRDAAAQSLGELKDHHAVAPLILALGDADPRVRADAAWSLASVPDTAATRPLLAALADRNKHVRQGAATALGSVGDARAAGALTRALRDPEKHVREAAAESLGKLRR